MFRIGLVNGGWCKNPCSLSSLKKSFNAVELPPPYLKLGFLSASALSWFSFIDFKKWNFHNEFRLRNFCSFLKIVTLDQVFYSITNVVHGRIFTQIAGGRLESGLFWSQVIMTNLGNQSFKNLRQFWNSFRWWFSVKRSFSEFSYQRIRCASIICNSPCLLMNLFTQ